MFSFSKKQNKEKKNKGKQSKGEEHREVEGIDQNNEILIQNRKIPNIDLECYMYIDSHVKTIIEYLSEFSDRNGNIRSFFSNGETGRLFHESYENCLLLRVDEAEEWSLLFEKIVKKRSTDLIDTKVAYVCHQNKLFYVDKTQIDKKNRVVELFFSEKNAEALFKEIRIMLQSKKSIMLNEEQLLKIAIFTGDKQKFSDLSYFNAIFKDNLIINAFGKLMVNLDIINAALIFEKMHSIADAFFEPIIRSKEWGSYWANQCELIDKSKDKNTQNQNLYSISQVRRMIVNAFCFRVFSGWSEKILNVLQEKKLVEEEREFNNKKAILTKILNMNDFEAFAADFKNKIESDCRSIYNSNYNEIQRNIKYGRAALNPCENIYFNLFANGNEIIKNFLMMRHREEREIIKNIPFPNEQQRQDEYQILSNILSVTWKSIFGTNVCEEDLISETLVEEKQSSLTFLIDSNGSSNESMLCKTRSEEKKKNKTNFNLTHSIFNLTRTTSVSSDGPSSRRASAGRASMDLDSPKSDREKESVLSSSLFKPEVIERKVAFVQVQINDNPAPSLI